MKDISILIGGKSGDGIETIAPIIAKILGAYGFYTHIYRDYPSLIRGGHTFSVIRASKEPVGALKGSVDVILALNQDCIDEHKDLISPSTDIVFDSGQVKAKGFGVDLTAKVSEMGLPPVVKNIGLVGAMCKILGIDWKTAQSILEKNTPKKVKENITIAKYSYDMVTKKHGLLKTKKINLPLLYGNEIIALGMVKAGLDMYIAYPMTPASSVLHYLAEHENDLDIKVIHPESEIGVITMANGAAYAGSRVAVGTSGGGFALMTEGVSLSGMGEYPVTIVMSQRPGPATGLPTYSAQADLFFVLHSGHGEFTRFVVAPGDAEQAYYWSGQALNFSWKYQIPSFVLVDKNISESVYTFDLSKAKEVKREDGILSDKKADYKRYRLTKNGVSPLAFPGDKKAIVKGTSYEHDEYGITIEDGDTSSLMIEKRLKKEIFLGQDIEGLDSLMVYGNKNSKTAMLCWGSVKEVALEVAEALNIKLIQPIVLSPLPVDLLNDALTGVTKIIDIEENATAQLASLLSQYGVDVDEVILKYNGRPFNFIELLENIKELI